MTKKQQKIKSNQKSKRQVVWMLAAQRLASEIQRLALSGEIVRAAKLHSRLFEVATMIPVEARQEIGAQLLTLWEHVERIEAIDGHAKSI